MDVGAKAELPGLRFEVRRMPEVDSTNRLLLEEARAGAPEGRVLVTDHQTAGRGRLGRTWTAPPGTSLLMSVLFRPGDLAVERVWLLAAAVAVAAAEACGDVGAAGVCLKWPNDLLGPDGRKLAGVLAEADLTGPRVRAVVVGMGMNVAWPEGLPDTAVSLAELAGRAIDRDELLEAVLRRLALHAGRASAAPTELMETYRSRCVTLGAEVRVELVDGVVLGTAVDVSDEGHLLVDTGEGPVRRLAVGDVVHLRPADQHH